MCCLVVSFGRSSVGAGEKLVTIGVWSGDDIPLRRDVAGPEGRVVSKLERNGGLRAEGLHCHCFDRISMIG